MNTSTADKRMGNQSDSSEAIIVGWFGKTELNIPVIARLSKLIIGVNKTCFCYELPIFDH